MSDPVLATRIRCDLCGSMVTKITNCECGCGVATCGLCGTYYHVMELKKPKDTPHRWWTT
jgi:transcription elongation factor Elf1